MIKWMALFVALLALAMAADKEKVGREFDSVRARLEAIESRKCTLTTVLTPTGRITVCALGD